MLDPLSFVLGALMTILGVGVGVILLYVLQRRHAARAQRERAQGDDRGLVLYTCRHHDIEFYGEENARNHAIEHHGAPTEGRAWEQTYPEGRGEHEA